jgi:hypothetical protein
MAARMRVASASAKELPMQTRGPLPKGKLARRWGAGVALCGEAGCGAVVAWWSGPTDGCGDWWAL